MLLHRPVLFQLTVLFVLEERKDFLLFLLFPLAMALCLFFAGLSAAIMIKATRSYSRQKQR